MSGERAHQRTAFDVMHAQLLVRVSGCDAFPRPIQIKADHGEDRIAKVRLQPFAGDGVEDPHPSVLALFVSSIEAYRHAPTILAEGDGLSIRHSGSADGRRYGFSERCRWTCPNQRLRAATCSNARAVERDRDREQLIIHGTDACEFAAGDGVPQRDGIAFVAADARDALLPPALSAAARSGSPMLTVLTGSGLNGSHCSTIPCMLTVHSRDPS